MAEGVQPTTSDMSRTPLPFDVLVHLEATMLSNGLSQCAETSRLRARLAAWPVQSLTLPLSRFVLEIELDGIEFTFCQNAKARNRCSLTWRASR